MTILWVTHFYQVFADCVAQLRRSIPVITVNCNWLFSLTILSAATIASAATNSQLHIWNLIGAYIDAMEEGGAVAIIVFADQLIDN